MRVRLCSFLKEFDWLKATLCCLGYPPGEGGSGDNICTIVGWVCVAMLQPLLSDCSVFCGRHFTHIILDEFPYAFYSEGVFGCWALRRFC